MSQDRCHRVLFDPSGLLPPDRCGAQSWSPAAARRILSSRNSGDQLTSERGSQPAGCGPPRERTRRSAGTGFDIGMGVWLGNTADGPGKQAVGRALTPGEQVGFADAAVSLRWNTNADFAAKGAAVAAKGSPRRVQSKLRHSARWTPSRTLLAGIRHRDRNFREPGVGAQGNTVIGPGSERIRATLGPDGGKASMRLPFQCGETMTLQTARSHISTAALVVGVLSLAPPRCSPQGIRTITPLPLSRQRDCPARSRSRTSRAGGSFRRRLVQLVMLRGPSSFLQRHWHEPKLRSSSFAFAPATGRDCLRSRCATYRTGPFTWRPTSGATT